MVQLLLEIMTYVHFDVFATIKQATTCKTLQSYRTNAIVPENNS